MNQGQRDVMMPALKIAERNHKPSSVGGLSKLEKQGNGSSPGVSRKECNPVDTLIFLHRKLIRECKEKNI